MEPDWCATNLARKVLRSRPPGRAPRDETELHRVAWPLRGSSSYWRHDWRSLVLESGLDAATRRYGGFRLLEQRLKPAISVRGRHATVSGRIVIVPAGLIEHVRVLLCTVHEVTSVTRIQENIGGTCFRFSLAAG